MEIKTTRNDSELTVALSGRLDTLTSPDLEEMLDEELEGMERLIFDLGELEYISSAGLRVLLGAYKMMEEYNGMLIRNVTEPVMDVFEVTGFSNNLFLSPRLLRFGEFYFFRYFSKSHALVFSANSYCVMYLPIYFDLANGSPSSKR